MSLTYHVCQGGLTATLIALAITDPVITVTDDYSIGPLQDVDAAYPRERTAFYTDIFRGLSGSPPFFLDRLTTTTRQLTAVCTGAENIILWSDDCAAARLLRLRLCWLLHHHMFTGRVFDVRFPLTGASVSSHIRCPLPLYSVTGIHSRLAERERLSSSALDGHARDWAALKSQASHGIRLFQANRWQVIAGDHYDDTLLAQVSTHKGPFDELISKAAVLTGQSKMLCLWRYSLFVRTGALRLTGDPIHEPATATLSVA